MARTTNLLFTKAQEDELVQYLAQRFTSLKSDNQARIKTDQESWGQYQLDVKRRQLMPGSIHALSNLCLPVYAMVCEHFVSRVDESTTAEEPFFHFEAVNISGERERQPFDDYFNWKLDEGKVHDAMQDARLAIVIQKAAIQKAVYGRETIRWIDRNKQILHEARAGGGDAPVEILDHGPIIRDEDTWVEQPDPAALPQAEGEPQPMRRHLAADPTLVFDENRHFWAESPNGIQREEVIYAGPKSEGIASDRFLCPMEAESPDAADVCMELQDRPLSWYRDNWLERPWARWQDWQQRLKTGDATSKPPESTTSLNLAPSAPPPEARGFDTRNPVRRIVECWMRRDVLGDGLGQPQDFVCWFDPEAQCLVSYEYLAKVCPDLRRPYTITSIGKTRKSWAGVSVWEKGKDLFDAVDRLFNGEFYRTLQQANPPKGGDPTAAIEEPRNIVSDPTKYYELHKGRTIEELLQYAKVPDTNARTQLVLEFIIYWIQLWLGVSNIAQGDYADVPANNTKYGIQKTLAEASKQMRRWIRRVITSDEEHLTKLVGIAIATVKADAQEVYEFTDGDQRKIAVILGATIQRARVSVKVIESQQHNESDIDRCNAALSTQDRFFTQINPEVRAAMRPLLTEILQDLGFKNAEELLPDFMAVPMTEAAMGGDATKVLAGAAGGGGAQQQPAPSSEAQGASTGA